MTLKEIRFDSIRFGSDQVFGIQITLKFDSVRFVQSFTAEVCGDEMICYLLFTLKNFIQLTIKKNFSNIYFFIIIYCTTIIYGNTDFN